jgi:hypothetical protein
VESLNKGLLLADDGTHLVHGGGHASERGQALNTLDIINLEGELAEVITLGLEVAKREGEDTAHEVVTSSALALSLVSGGNTSNAGREVGGSLKSIPLLALESVDGLLVAFLLLTKSLVLANSHGYYKEQKEKHNQIIRL